MYAGHFDFTVPLLGEIDDVYTRDQCAAWIARLAGADWLPATVNRASGREVDARLRNNATAIVRDDAAAADLWARVAPHVPARLTAEGRAVHAVGLFLPMRVYRYQVGERFGLHQDQSYARDDGARSRLTLLVYLSDDLDGGETDFPEQGRTIVPRAGCALWFQHMLLHAGIPVTRGVKYVLRTDVLYAARE
jgi:predicted 2-oxoglutarate/Fe(II)-dependent dioxygenase YbiX